MEDHAIDALCPADGHEGPREILELESNYGIVTPTGKFVPCEWSSHSSTLREWFDLDCVSADALGYIRVSTQISLGCRRDANGVLAWVPMTRAQKRTLEAWAEAPNFEDKREERRLLVNHAEALSGSVV